MTSSTSFFVSVNPHTRPMCVEPYPDKFTSQIEDHYKKLKETFSSNSDQPSMSDQSPNSDQSTRGGGPPVSTGQSTDGAQSTDSAQPTFTDCNKITTYQKMIQSAPRLNQSSSDWTLLPNFYNSYISFYINNKNCPNEICGIQRTPANGERYVFRIEVVPGQTTYTNPIDQTFLPIPDYIIDRSIEQYPIWGWHDEYVTYCSLSNIRRLSGKKFTPYPADINVIIEEYYNNGEVNGDLNFAIGIVPLTLKPLPDVSPEFLVQYHGTRCHFVERKMMTPQQIDSHSEQLTNDYLELCETAVGDTETCPICLIDLKSSKCVLLPCKHMFHGLCAQTHATANGSTCAICKQPTNIFTTESSNMTLMSSGR